MRDWIFAFVALGTLIAFFLVVIWRVPHVDLVIVILIGLGLAVYDIVSSVRRNG